MKKYPTLKNPPITEAALDIKVDLPKGVNLQTLELFHGRIKDRFPVKKILMRAEGMFEFKEGKIPKVVGFSDAGIGFEFRSNEEKIVTRARIDGFLFSKLRPYETWESFFENAKALWHQYSELTNPIKIKRLGLRYINRINLPLPINNFGDFLKTKPEIADGISQVFSNFFVRLVVLNTSLQGSFATIIQTTEKVSDDQKWLSLILDIDAYYELPLEPKDEKIWDIYENLREFKNDIFFKSITDKTKELFV